jgi:hypothetical protein
VRGTIAVDQRQKYSLEVLLWFSVQRRIENGVTQGFELLFLVCPESRLRSLKCCGDKFFVIGESIETEVTYLTFKLS